MTTATMTNRAEEIDAYRKSLIYQLCEHTPQTIRDDMGGWASDRIREIGQLEADLCELEADFTPFNLVLWEGGLQDWSEPEKPWMLD